MHSMGLCTKLLLKVDHNISIHNSDTRNVVHGTYVIHLFIVHVDCVDLSCKIVDLSGGLEDGHGSGQLLALKDVHVTLHREKKWKC